ncbi:MAG: hypothetical protein QOJ17_2479, partial [Rhodospirillaceae bacterium]|nr:hypothetical protein [Rhodospirillaceae bacterium]
MRLRPTSIRNLARNLAWAVVRDGARTVCLSP